MVRRTEVKEAMMKIQLSGHVRRGTRFHIAFCRQLPISTSGATSDEAIKSVPDAALSYLSAVRAVDPDRFKMLLATIGTPIIDDPAVEDDSEPFVWSMPEAPMRALVYGIG